MEYTLHGEPIETFDDVIQELTDFKNCALDLSKRYKGILYCDFITNNTIENKLQRYLKFPKNTHILQNYLKVLKRITSQKIKKALPDGSMNDSIIFAYTEEEKRQEEEKIRQEIKDKINGVIVFITEVINRYKATSVKTKYFDKPIKPKIEYNKLKAFEKKLVKAELIKSHIDFVKIFRGQAPDERIDWIDTKSSFTYFIKQLFNTETFKDEKEIWIVAGNTFTIEGNPLPINIHRFKKEDVKRKTLAAIDSSISLIDRP